MAHQAGGLSTPAEIEALADQLSGAADDIHEQILKAIRKGTQDDGTIEGIDQLQAQQLFDQEMLLRQKAIGLYVDAARLTVKDLGLPQQQIIALTAAAREKLRRIARIADFANIVADVVALAGAVAGAKPKGVVKALENLRHHAADATEHVAAPADPAAQNVPPPLA